MLYYMKDNNRSLESKNKRNSKTSKINYGLSSKNTSEDYKSYKTEIKRES